LLLQTFKHFDYVRSSNSVHTTGFIREKLKTTGFVAVNQFNLSEEADLARLSTYWA